MISKGGRWKIMPATNPEKLSPISTFELPEISDFRPTISARRQYLVASELLDETTAAKSAAKDRFRAAKKGLTRIERELPGEIDALNLASYQKGALAEALLTGGKNANKISARKRYSQIVGELDPLTAAIAQKSASEKDGVLTIAFGRQNDITRVTGLEHDIRDRYGNLRDSYTQEAVEENDFYYLKSGNGYHRNLPYYLYVDVDGGRRVKPRHFIYDAADLSDKVYQYIVYGRLSGLDRDRSIVLVGEDVVTKLITKLGERPNPSRGEDQLLREMIDSSDAVRSTFPSAERRKIALFAAGLDPNLQTHAKRWHDNDRAKQIGEAVLNLEKHSLRFLNGRSSSERLDLRFIEDTETAQAVLKRFKIHVSEQHGEDNAKQLAELGSMFVAHALDSQA